MPVQDFSDGKIAGMFDHPDPDHEQKNRWVAVDTYTMQHLHHHRSLDAALQTSANAGLLNVATPPTQAKLLSLLCTFGKVEHGLEVGCLGGYFAAFVTKLNPDLQLTTLERDLEAVAVAQHNFEQAGVTGQIEIIAGDAIDTMAELVKEVQSGKRLPYDFTYVDANKEGNWTYMDMAIQMSRKGSVIVVDNIVVMGKIAEDDAQPNEFVRGARECIENAGKDKRVQATVLQTLCEKTYDGFLLAVVQ